MTTVNMLEAKTSLSRLVDAVESEIIIARNGRPAARIVPIAAHKPGRRLGVAKSPFDVPATIDADNEAIAASFAGDTA